MAENATVAESAAVVENATEVPHKHEQTVLEALDDASLSWFHVKAIIISGMGFFTDAYDLFSIGLLTKLIGHIYYNGSPPLNVTSAISAVALCGTLAGQLFFGWAGDKFGRKGVYGATLFIMIFSSICSGLSFGRTPEAVVGTLCFFRFILGFGVGGDYPLSATIMSEYSSKSSRGAFVAAVFAMQGTGILLAATVTIIIAAGTRLSPENPENADYVWRGVLMFAAVPTALTIYARNKLPETARYTLNVKHNTQAVERDMAGLVGVHTADSYKHIHLKQSFTWTFPFIVKLVGCAITWFLLDIAFYSQNLFQSDIYTTIGWVPDVNVYWPESSPEYIHNIAKTCTTAQPLIFQGIALNGTKHCDANLRGCEIKSAGCWLSPLEQTYLIARAQAITALCSTIPGYWFTVFTIERLGRWNIQMMGFFFMTVFMAFLAGFYNYFLDHVGGFMALYALTFFFANWGPNSTTFVIPAEIFPSVVRSTAHGIAAAAGKAGAIIGAFGFLYASKDPRKPSDLAAYGNVGIGIQKSLGILAAINFAGMLFTLLVPEVKTNTSLEEVAGEIDESAMSPASPTEVTVAEPQQNATNEPTSE